MLKQSKINTLTFATASILSLPMTFYAIKHLFQQIEIYGFDWFFAVGIMLGFVAQISCILDLRNLKNYPFE